MLFYIINTYLVLVNAAACLLMLIDKLRAKRGAWRIRESTLMGVALLGGSLGTIVGMLAFRHKTRHIKFYLGLPLILICQLVICFLLVP